MLGIVFGLFTLSTIISVVLSVGEHPRLCDGNPCDPIIEDNEVGPFVFTHGYACDPWCITHIVTPILLTVFLGSPWTAFLIVGIAEIAETFLAATTSGYAIFLENAASYTWENMVGAFVDDWLIQGGIGVFIGWLLLITFRPYDTKDSMNLPISWDGLLTGQPLPWFNTGYGILGVGILPLFYNFGINAFSRLGVVLHPIIQIILLFILWQIQGNFGGALDWTFYIPLFVLIAIYHGLNTFEWFCSCAVQSWIISAGVIVILCLLWVMKPRWKRAKSKPVKYV